MTARIITLAPPEELRARKRMAELAQTFPSLRLAQGVDPFDAEELDRWANGPVSHGQRVSAQFVLAVWSPEQCWKCGRFNLMGALSLFDPTHHQAFLTWVSDPWWP